MATVTIVFDPAIPEELAAIKKLFGGADEKVSKPEESEAEIETHRLRDVSLADVKLDPVVFKEPHPFTQSYKGANRPTKKERVRALFTEGKTPSQIATELGMSKAGIYNYIHQLGLSQKQEKTEYNTTRPRGAKICMGCYQNIMAEDVAVEGEGENGGRLWYHQDCVGK